MHCREALRVITEGEVGSKYHEAIEVCKKALNKQIPAKPYCEMYCPLCDFFVGDQNGDHFLYCPMCGQRIDFGDNNRREDSE